MTKLIFIICLLSIIFNFFIFMMRRPPRSTLFPTRRSSDLARLEGGEPAAVGLRARAQGPGRADPRTGAEHRMSGLLLDRKSTRLNSSHSSISYAVFCLKKKKYVVAQPHPLYYNSAAPSNLR